MKRGKAVSEAGLRGEDKGIRIENAREASMRWGKKKKRCGERYFAPVFAKSSEKGKRESEQVVIGAKEGERSFEKDSGNCFLQIVGEEREEIH